MKNQLPTTDAVYGHLTNQERRYVLALQKRKDWLAQRINDSPHALSYDNQERAALEWALSVIANARKEIHGLSEGQELV